LTEQRSSVANSGSFCRAFRKIDMVQPVVTGGDIDVGVPDKVTYRCE
jgi:hypothetical protein